MWQRIANIFQKTDCVVGVALRGKFSAVPALRLARRSLSVLLVFTLTLPLGAVPASAQSAFKVSDTTPKGFEALTEPQTTLLDVYYAGRQIASTMTTFSAESVVFANPIEILSKIPRLKNQAKLLSVLSGPMAPNVQLVCFEDAKPESPCGKLRPDDVGVILDEGNFRVDIFIHPDFLDIHELGIPRYLPPSGTGLSIVSSFAGAVSGSASTTNTHNTRNQTVIGRGESRARINSSYSNTDEWFFDTAFMEHDIREQRYMAGMFQTRSMDNIGEIKILGAGYTTTTDTRVDLDIGFGNQLVVFLPNAAQVDIFKDDRLIGSRFYEAGKQIIDTSQLPEGAYDVTLKIKERGGATREETHFYTKATNLPPADTPLYYFEGGLLLNDVTSPLATRSNVPILHYGAMFRFNDNWGIGGDFITSDKVSVGEFRTIYLGRDLRFRGAAVLTTDDDIAASLTASGSVWDTGYTLALRRNWAGGALPATEASRTFDPIGGSFTQARGSLSYTWGQAQYSWSSLYQANEGSADTYSHGPTFTYPLYRDAKWSAILRMEATRSQDQTVALARVQIRLIDPTWSAGVSSGVEILDNHAGTAGEGYSSDISTNASWQEDDLVPGDLTLGGAFNMETGLRTMQTNANYASKWGRYSMDVDRSWGRNSSGDGASVASNFATSLISDGSTVVLGGKERRDSGIVVTLNGRAKDAVFRVVVDGLPSGEIQVGESLPVLLGPYKTYGIRIEPVGGDFVSYEAEDQEVTLYPGNVASVVWSINPIVAVFGRVVREDGTPVAFARIEGVASGAFTDDLGYFQTELTDPGVLTFRPAQGSVCKVEIPVLPEGEVYADLKDLVCRAVLLEARTAPAKPEPVAQVASAEGETAEAEKAPDWSGVVAAYQEDLDNRTKSGKKPPTQAPEAKKPAPAPAPVVIAVPDAGPVEAATQKLEAQVAALEEQVTAAERAAELAAKKPPPRPVEPATPLVAPQTSKAVARTAPAANYRVQLAAFRDRDRAFTGWRKINDRAGPLLAGKHGVVARADLGEKGTFYRLQTGPLSERAEARELCDRLLGQSVSCRVVRIAASVKAKPADECLLDATGLDAGRGAACRSEPGLIAANNAAVAAVTPAVRPGQTVGAASGVSFDAGVRKLIYRVQLGSHRSEQDAKRDWRRLVALSEGFLSGLEPIVSRADLGDRGIYHRLQIDAPGRRSDAAALCRDLKALDLPCLVVRRPTDS